MVIETIALLAFVFAIGVVVVKIYEWRQDVWPGRTGGRACASPFGLHVPQLLTSTLAFPF